MEERMFLQFKILEDKTEKQNKCLESLMENQKLLMENQNVLMENQNLLLGNQNTLENKITAANRGTGQHILETRNNHAQTMESLIHNTTATTDMALVIERHCLPSNRRNEIRNIRQITEQQLRPHSPSSGSE